MMWIYVSIVWNKMILRFIDIEFEGQRMHFHFCANDKSNITEKGDRLHIFAISFKVSFFFLMSLSNIKYITFTVGQTICSFLFSMYACTWCYMGAVIESMTCSCSMFCPTLCELWFYVFHKIITAWPSSMSRLNLTNFPYKLSINIVYHIFFAWSHTVFHLITRPPVWDG